MANNQKNYCVALWCGAAAIALAVPAVANAQQASSAPAADESLSNEEIIVTATRREERLKDVPISVTALSAQALANSGVTNSRELALVTPGLRFDGVGSTIVPTIRGITTTLASGNEANVSTYVDGIYQVSAAGVTFELPDVKQVEVLKGPQGTLFGRNATGGAILIQTMAPDLNDFTGNGRVSDSNFHSLKASGFVSAPIVQDKLAVSLTGYYNHMTKGYLHNLVNNGKIEGGTVNSKLVRGKIRFIPADGADFTLQSTWQKRYDGTVLKNVNYKGNNAQALALPASTAYTGPLAVNAWDYASNINPFTYTDQFNTSLHGTIEMGPGTLTLNSAYIHNYTNQLSDSDNTTRAIAALVSGYKMTTFTDEVLYTTDQIGAFHAVVGANYFNNKVVAHLASNTNAFVDRNIIKAEAAALFGEGSFNFTDQLILTAGARFSVETKDPYKVSVFGTTVLPAGTPRTSAGHQWKSFDPRVSLLYKVTDTTNVYATVSRGFKSGEFNVAGTAAQTVPAKPERITAYEAGVKSSVMSGLSINAAIYHYDYTDLQVTAFQSVGTVITQQLTNAAKAKITGAEFSADWRVTPELKLSTGINYLHARYSSFPTASYTTPRRELPGQVCPVATNPAATAATTPICTIQGDVSGNTMVRSPTFSGNATANYRTETSVGIFDASGTVFYSSKVYYDVSNRVQNKAYAFINATLGWAPLNSGFKFEIWAKNLNNGKSIQSLVNTTAYDTVVYSPPREIGATASFKF